MVLASLGVMAVLLLTFIASTGFVSNEYQRVYGAPGTLIYRFHPVKVKLSGFPNQTSESVTNIRLTEGAGPLCEYRSTGGGPACKGVSNIVIPGIGEVRDVTVDISVKNIHYPYPFDPALTGWIGPSAVFSSYYFSDAVYSGFFNVQHTVNIRDIGSGQVTVELSATKCTWEGDPACH